MPFSVKVRYEKSWGIIAILRTKRIHMHLIVSEINQEEFLELWLGLWCGDSLVSGVLEELRLLTLNTYIY